MGYLCWCLHDLLMKPVKRIVPSLKKLIPYRTGRYLSYRSVNRYRNTYVSFCFKFRSIPEKIGCFGLQNWFSLVKKKPKKHTTKKEKSQENVIATAFSLAPFFVSSSCIVLFLQPSSRPTSSSSLFYIVSLVGVLKIWLEGMPSLFPSCFVRWPVLFSMQKLKNIFKS